MYEPPIKMIIQQLETDIREQQEKQIFQAIEKVGVAVERNELIKALQYDRQQYNKGYADGKAEATRWISVEETLPEDGEDVLVHIKYNDVVSDTKVAYRVMKKWYHRAAHRVGGVVTHWMPLPEPPET